MKNSYVTAIAFFFKEDPKDCDYNVSILPDLVKPIGVRTEVRIFDIVSLEKLASSQFEPGDAWFRISSHDRVESLKEAARVRMRRMLGDMIRSGEVALDIVALAE